MWLRTVGSAISSRSAIAFAERPCVDQREHLELAPRQARRPPGSGGSGSIGAASIPFRSTWT